MLLPRLFWNTLGPRTKQLNELLFEAIDSLGICQPPSLEHCKVKTSVLIALSSAVISVCVASVCTCSPDALGCGLPATVSLRPRKVPSRLVRAFSTLLRAVYLSRSYAFEDLLRHTAFSCHDSTP